MSLINFVSDLPSPNVRGDLLYQGIVVDNNDPLKIGRVRVRVSQFLPEEAISSSHCPWAVMRRPSGFGGQSERSDFFIPSVGSKVLVQFSGGEIYSPIYETCPPDNLTKIADMSTHYPNRCGWKDNDGSSLVIDFTDHTLDYTNASGFEFHIRQDKNVDIILPQDKVESISRDETRNIGRDSQLDIQRNLTETIAGNVNTTATGTVKITGSSTTLLGSGASTVKLGSETPVDFIALLSSINKILTAFNAHTHSGVTVGGGTSGTPSTPLATFISGTDYTSITKAS